MLLKHIPIYQNISLLVIWIIVQTTSTLYISEQSNFQPCSFNNGVLICDNKILVIASALQFPISPTTKVNRLEILNFPLTEIPDNYLTSFADNLLNVKIHSNVTIKSISQKAFKGCSKLISLEIRSPLTKEESFIDLNEVFKDLVSLEDLKLVNLNISDLKFNYLQKLTTLSIEDPNLNTISNDIFQNCPLLSTLNIVGMKNSLNLLEQFHKWPESNRVLISSLKLENCNLISFPRFVRNFAKNLTHLSLTKNPIQKIDLDDTTELIELQNLILSGTTLVDTEMSGLGKLKKLKVLELIDIATIRNLPLEIENLEFLEIINIDMSQFDQISIVLPDSIRRVSAGYLKKSIKIESNFLSKTNKLNILILNKLQTSEMKFLTDNIKVFQDSLRTLSLEESILLKKDMWNVIQSLKQLETLYLSDANIESIPDEVLMNLRNLKKLSLSRNKLRYETINTIGFQSISNHLTHLDLSFNQLINLPPCLFYPLPNLLNVNLVESGIDCDCHLLWLYEKVKLDSIFSPLLNFTCGSGKNAGKHFYQLSEKDLKRCSSTIDSCLPLKSGNYTIKFDLVYRSGESFFNIENMEASYLKFLFDYIKVGVKQENKTVHSEIDKYELNRTWIRMNKDIHSNIFSVCLILVRNMEEYNLDYNCKVVPNEIPPNKVSLVIILGASLGPGLLVMIIVFIIIMCLWKPAKRKIEEDVHYSTCSSKYSEADETYQNPDQYSEIPSNEEYQIDENEMSLHNSYSFNTALPNYYHHKKNLKRMAIPSKSVDGGLNVSRISINQPKFQKIKTKLSKQKSEFISLHDISALGNSLPRKYQSTTRASLPQQYISRDLPIPPEANNPCLETFPKDLPPPKPMFPSTNIKNLLNNADNHLDYFRNYVSNKSLCTDESANHPHSGDSGLGVSKLSNLSQFRLSQDNSVII